MSVHAATTRCLVLGDAHHAEMTAVAEFLAADDVHPVDDPSVADLVLVCLTDPDAYSATEVAEVLAASPLARFVVAKSSYCESTGRTRDLWPLAAQTPARHAASRLSAERSVLSGTRRPLPLTASRDETWAFDHRPSDENGSAEVQVGVESPDRELARNWTDQLHASGFTVATPDHAPRSNVLVLDGDPWCDRVRDRVVARNEAALPTVLVMTMPPVPPPVETEGGLVMIVPKLGPAESLEVSVRRAAGRVGHSG